MEWNFVYLLVHIAGWIAPNTVRIPSFATRRSVQDFEGRANAMRI